MTHKTKGIVLNTVKYGETSLVLTIFTELFGVQAYIMNGVRTARRSGSKSIMLQPSAILDMEVYHNELKAMHRIRECSWSYLYNQVLSNVTRNSIAMYMVELLQKTLRQPEANPDLFYFCEDIFKHLDAAESHIAANLPLFFALHLADFFGFKINVGNTGNEYPYLDLREGEFVAAQPEHAAFLSPEFARITAEILMMRVPDELEQLKLNKQARRELLMKYQDYYALHIPGFGKLKTLQVLNEVLY